MRKLIILFIVAIVMSCNQKKSHNNFCLKNIEYINQREKLIPSIVNIQIEDNDGFLIKKIVSGKLKTVFLCPVKKKERKFFYLMSYDTGKQFKVENNIIILPILIATYFEDELKIKLSNQEIGKRITGDVGLVFERDTIIIKKCDK
jgi:hypothetical protein